VSYWIPGWPLGFGGNSAGQSSNTYGNFPSFDFSDGPRRLFPTCATIFERLVVGSEGGGMGLGMNGINQGGAFASFAFLQGVQVGYNFQNVAGSPLRVFAGFDTLKYNTGLGLSWRLRHRIHSRCRSITCMPAIDSSRHRTQPVARGWLTQQTGRIDSGINSTHGAWLFSVGHQRSPLTRAFQREFWVCRQIQQTVDLPHQMISWAHDEIYWTRRKLKIGA